MPKTRSYCYWLKSFEKPICFRLEMNSEAFVLWNYYFSKKKNRIKVTIEQIIKMARERIGSKKKYETFILDIMHEVGDSGQKTFDRIFKLALERHQQLYHEGRAPRLLPPSYVPPEVSREEAIKTEAIKTTEKTLDKVKAWFPKDLQNLLTSSFEIKFDEPKRNVIIRQKAFVNDKPSWWNINNIIIQKHQGRRTSEGKYPSWIIPLK